MAYSQALVFCLLAASAAAFTPTFKYGCNTTHCQYQFVVSEDVAAYVDPYVLQSDISQVNLTVSKVYNSSQTLNDATLRNFTDAFNYAYAETSPEILSTIDNVNAAADLYDAANDTSFDLQQDSFNIALLADCLSKVSKNDPVQTANCLSNAAPFALTIDTVALPTTIAPATTVAQTTPGIQDSTSVALDGITAGPDGYF